MPHKLLLADDSVTIQRVIELTFADEDIQVLAVGDGKKAIAAIQSERPDIVLADVGMPERDGYEVASFIKTSQEYAHIPVLLLTGAFEPIDEARARSVGCDGVLVKPFEPQMVINRVKDLLAGRRESGPWSAAAAGTASSFGFGAAPAQPQAGGIGGGAKPASGAGPAGVPAGSLEDYFDRLDAAFASMESGASVVVEPPQGAPPVRSALIEAPESTTHPQQGGGYARAPQSGQLAGFAQAPLQVEGQPAHQQAASASHPSQGGGLPEAIADWDPDLTGDPHKPAPLEPRPIDLDPARGFAPVRRSPADAALPPAPAQAAPLAIQTTAAAAALPGTSAASSGPAPSAPAAWPGGSAPAPSASAASPGMPSPGASAAAAFPAATYPGAAFTGAPPAATSSAATSPAAATPAEAPPAAPGPPPTLAEAFAALLSAEQGRPVAPPAIAPLPDSAVDQIVQRVITRMADAAVRDTVVDVAERLVREEIARIKTAQ